MMFYKIYILYFSLLLKFFSPVNCLMDGETFSDFYTPYRSGKIDFVWNEALNVMSYHRNKMNEYLCNNYLASEILEGYRNRSGENVEKRMGKPLETTYLARNSLLGDPGSQKYKDWLSRSSTLEDIYRQFEHSEKDLTAHHEPESSHDGDVTGYALLSQSHLHSKPGEYGGESHFFDTDSDSHSHDNYEDDHEEKGLKLKELFHFALTAIAFLAFATFMIEVIMCLMEVPQPADPDYVLMPTTTGATGPAFKANANDSEADRQGRGFDIFRSDPVSLEVLNTMSGKVLTSIEAFAILYEDDGQCLKKALCQNSKYSKILPGLQKVWLPIWSFGASWVAGRLSGKRNQSKESDALEYLKAAVMGLGNKECQVLYPNCDEKQRRKKRKAL